jgi:hypothetical protein
MAWWMAVPAAARVVYKGTKWVAKRYKKDVPKGDRGNPNKDIYALSGVATAAGVAHQAVKDQFPGRKKKKAEYKKKNQQQKVK